VDPDTLQLAEFNSGSQFRSTSIFPAITIGLASYLAVLEGCWLRNAKRGLPTPLSFLVQDFRQSTFGMGVVSGLVMAYEFGTNWSHFSAFAGGITGAS